MRTASELLALNLKRLRDRLGYSQDRLAEVAQVAPQVIQRAESMNAFPRQDKISNIAKALDCPESELFRDPDLNPAPTAEDAIKIIQQALISNGSILDPVAAVQMKYEQLSQNPAVPLTGEIPMTANNKGSDKVRMLFDPSKLSEEHRNLFQLFYDGLVNGGLEDEQIAIIASTLKLRRKRRAKPEVFAKPDRKA